MATFIRDFIERETISRRTLILAAPSSSPAPPGSARPPCPSAPAPSAPP